MSETEHPVHGSMSCEETEAWNDDVVGELNEISTWVARHGEQVKNEDGTWHVIEALARLQVKQRKAVVDEVVAVLIKERDENDPSDNPQERHDYDVIDRLMRRVVLDVGGKSTCVHPDLGGPCSGCAVIP